MRVLSVSMYSDIWIHSFPQHVIGRELRDSGDEVCHLRCRGVLSTYCNAMAARGLREEATPEERASVCRSCRKRTRLLSVRSGMDETYLDDQLNEFDVEVVNAYVNSVNAHNWTEIELEGVNVARLSAYEFFLQHKLNSLVIPDELWITFLGYVRNAALTLVGAKRVIDEWAPDRILVYNSMYASNNVISRYAATKGIPCTSIHAGQNIKHRYGTLAVYDAAKIPHMAFSSEEWIECRDKEMQSVSASLVVDHLLEVFGGQSRFVYSRPLTGGRSEDLREKFGIPDESKVLVATMSSLDETIGARLAGIMQEESGGSLYPRAVEWVDALRRFAESRPNSFIIVRVHPREFPNKRESVLSQNALELQKHLETLPFNMVVNWPDDNISLYDLASITDVCLNFSSTAGIEMMALGIPTIIPRYEMMVAYDPDIGPVAETELQYFGLVDDALEAGWSVENIRRAFRWWAFVFTRLAADISDAFTYPTAGYLSVGESRASTLRNAALKLMAKWLPPVMEIRDLTRRYELVSGPLLVDAIHDSVEFLIGPESRDVHQSEDVLLASQLSRLIDVFDAFGMQGVSYVENMRAFVSSQISRTIDSRSSS